METEVESTLSRIDLFKGVAMEKIRATRLGGLTNRSYEIESPVGHFVLRVPGEGTGDIIDRGIEEHNARVAAEAGVNAQSAVFPCHGRHHAVPLRGVLEDYGYRRL